MPSTYKIIKVQKMWKSSNLVWKVSELFKNFSPSQQPDSILHFGWFLPLGYCWWPGTGDLLVSQCSNSDKIEQLYTDLDLQEDYCLTGFGVNQPPLRSPLDSLSSGLKSVLSFSNMTDITFKFLPKFSASQGAHLITGSKEMSGQKGYFSKLVK